MLYDKARKQFAEMEYLKALAGADEALKADPAFAPALFLKSQSLMELYARESFSASKEERAARLGQIKEAAELTAEYLRQNPNLTYGQVWREQLKALQAYVRFSQPSKDPASPNAVFTSKELTNSPNEVSNITLICTEHVPRACKRRSIS